MADTPRHHTLPSFLAFVLSVAADLVEKALGLPAVDVQAVDAVAGLHQKQIQGYLTAPLLGACCVQW